MRYTAAAGSCRPRRQWPLPVRDPVTFFSSLFRRTGYYMRHTCISSRISRRQIKRRGEPMGRERRKRRMGRGRRRKS
uniref:Uncharacterized protein n=1 Tax=Arundo donax TaxID=35708 RepID=A0A0A8XW82_ARUDO